ncbi:MAG TPA: imidazole glycerol phosphate synthase subunit HisH [Acidimicrobiales bacterium]|nr:imidazole glycerol phosphate synthase subunit HisH [Acidimicrobiales bacterium]
MIAVLDYGIGNLRSAEKALQHVGADARLVADPDEAVTAGGVVLPGVGAFGACSDALRRSGLDEVVRAAVASGVPFLGICVGFQLMFEGSDEDPAAAGLGIFDGVVRALPASERRPQMQWNVVQRVPGHPSVLLAPEGGAAQWYYFVHSYAPVPAARSESAVVGLCDYGGEVVAAMETPAVFGTQFHPEKSGPTGLGLLQRFAARCDATWAGR